MALLPRSCEFLLCWTCVFLLLQNISILAVEESNTIQTVSVEIDGSTEPTALPLDKVDDPTVIMNTKLEALHEQIVALKSIVTLQQETIQTLNETLDTFVFTANEYGVVYDKSDDRPLLLTSAVTHDVPFVMLNVISVRLPKRSSYHRKDKRKKGRGILSASKSLKKAKKSRYLHVLITLSRDGIFQLWDDDQNELHTYFDSSILSDSMTISGSDNGNDGDDNNDGDGDDEKDPYPSSSDDAIDAVDALVNADSNFIVYSDVISSNKFGNTWFVMARNDSAFVKLYAVSASRDSMKDPENPNVRKSIISGHIAPENTIYRPTDSEVDQFRKENRGRNRRTRRSAADRTQMVEDEEQKKKDDINGFDVESSASSKSTEPTQSAEAQADGKGNGEDSSSSTDPAQCSVDDTECGAKRDGDPDSKGKEQSLNEDGDSIELEVDGDDDEKEGNATVTGLTVYNFAGNKKQYIIVAYSDNKIYSYRKNGKLSSSAKSIPYIAPNNSIAFISTTRQKSQLVVVTDAGFQFLKVPKLNKIGPFCHLPSGTTVTSVQFDVVSQHTMILGTSDGRVIVYDTKKLKRKMCVPMDEFGIEPQSALRIETLPGYWLVTSTEGLHVYNVTKKSKSGVYQRPGLLFVRSFEDEFEETDTRLAGSNVLVSSFTDVHQHTVIAYAQSTDGAVEGDDVSYGFVVMESYLPNYTSGDEKTGVIAMVTKTPLFLIIAFLAVFWVMFKGKGGNTTSPLGRLGQLFGGRKGRTRTPLRGGQRGRGIGDTKMERWQDKHGSVPRGGRMGSSNMSSNMKYGTSASRRMGLGPSSRLGGGPSSRFGGGF